MCAALQFALKVDEKISDNLSAYTDAPDLFPEFMLFSTPFKHWGKIHGDTFFAWGNVGDLKEILSLRGIILEFCIEMTNE